MLFRSGSIVLQGALSIVLIFTHPLQQVLQNIGAVLTLFAGLTCLSLFRVRFRRTGLPKPSAAALAAASIFAVSAAWMLYFGFRSSPLLVAWIAVILFVALGAYQLTSRRRIGDKDRSVLDRK